MQHRGHERVGHPVPRYIENGDPGGLLAAPQVLDDLQSPLLGRLPDSEIEIEPLLEVHVDQVVSAHRTVQGECAAVNVHAAEPGDVARFRDQMFDDLFEILQLVGQLNHRVSSFVALFSLMLEQHSSAPCESSRTLAGELGSWLGERRAPRRREQRGHLRA